MLDFFVLFSLVLLCGREQEDTIYTNAGIDNTAKFVRAQLSSRTPYDKCDGEGTTCVWRWARESLRQLYSLFVTPLNSPFMQQLQSLVFL